MKIIFKKIKNALKRAGSSIKTGFHRAKIFLKACFQKVWLFLKARINRVRFKKLNKKRLVVGSVLVLLACGVIYIVVNIIQITSNPHRVFLGKPVVAGQEYTVGEEFSEHIVNIALLGFDRDSEREEYADLFLPDFIAVISIDFRTDEINFVRVPRDTYVRIHATGVKDKINHSYYHGYHYGKGKDRDADGMHFTLETVSYLLGGIPIHNYVAIDMDGLVYLVDAMGGVWYDVEEDLYYRGALLLAKGEQHLMGWQVLTYVRYRDDHTGQDIGRIQRQFDLIMAMFNYYREYDLFQHIPMTFKVYRDYIDTDLNLKQVAALAYYGRDLNMAESGIIFVYLEGSHQTKDGIWYWVLNQAQRVGLIKDTFGVAAQLWPQEVLRDTVPPKPELFDYTLRYDDDGAVAVSLFWEPDYVTGIKPQGLRYELYRDEDLLGTLEETYYLDTDVEMDETYQYKLIVYHYREPGPPVTLLVTVGLYVEEIEFTPPGSIEATADDPTYDLKGYLEIIPEEAIYESITWKSDNTNIAAVSKDGILTVKKDGTVKITVIVESTDGQTFTKRADINVKFKVEDEENTNNEDEING